MSIYRTIMVMAVILIPGYALADIYAQGGLERIDIAENAQNSDNTKFYVPSRITVDVGTTVEWVNFDDAMHTVTDGKVSGKDYKNGLWGTVFDSGVMRLDDVYKFTFDEAGEYPYLCAFHPWMFGRVSVLPPGGIPQVEVSLSTDRGMYMVGDGVTVSGIISQVAGESPVLIEILNPEQTVFDRKEIAVGGNGSFRFDFKLEGNLAVAGTYTVKATYLDMIKERTFVVEPGTGTTMPPGEAGSVDVKVAAKQVKDLFIMRVRNSADSGASIYGVSFEVPDHMISAFKGPRDWSRPDTIFGEARSSATDEPVRPGDRIYFRLKVDADQADGLDVELISWAVFDTTDSILDHGDTKPIVRRR